MKILGLEYCSPNDLELSEFNVRKIELTKESLTSLLDSILEFGGIIEPIIITKEKKIVCGRRRWEASKLAKLDKIPCMVVEFEPRFEDDKDIEKTVVSYIENKVYQIMTDDEETVAVNKMREKNLTIQRIANLLGVPSYSIGELSARSRTPPAFQISEKTEETEDNKYVQHILDPEEQKKVQLSHKFKELSKAEPRKYRIVRRLLQKSPYKDDLSESAKLLEFSQKGTLRMLEDIEKDIKVKAKPNLNFRIKVAENKEGYILRQARFPKVVNVEMGEYCRRYSLDFYDWLTRGAVHLMHIKFK